MIWKKKYPNTLQHDQSDCAAAVISSVLLVYKKEMSIMKIREVIGQICMVQQLKVSLMD